MGTREAAQSRVTVAGVGSKGLNISVEKPPFKQGFFSFNMAMNVVGRLVVQTGINRDMWDHKLNHTERFS